MHIKKKDTPKFKCFNLHSLKWVPESKDLQASSSSGNSSQSIGVSNMEYN